MHINQSFYLSGKFDNLHVLGWVSCASTGGMEAKQSYICPEGAAQRSYTQASDQSEASDYNT